MYSENNNNNKKKNGSQSFKIMYHKVPNMFQHTMHVVTLSFGF